MGIIKLMVFLWVFSASAMANDAQKSFDMGNQLLRDGKVMEALKTFQSIEQQGLHSGPLFLNIGIIYTDLDSLGKAKAYFFKAKAFPETQLQAQQGVDFVDRKLPNKAIQLPKLPWDRAVDVLKAGFSVNGLLFLSAFFIWLTAAFLVLGWIHPRFIWMKSYFPATFLILALLCISLSGYLHYHLDRYGHAVLTVEQSSLKEKPEEDAGVVGIAYEGFSFLVDYKIKADRPDWLYVRMSNGQFGWIKTAHILTY